MHQEEDVKSRKYYTYQVCKNFESRGVSKILLPCFASHSFLNELQKEITIPIVNIFDALLGHVTTKVRKGAKIGMLTSDFMKSSGMLDTYFADYQLVFPTDQARLMDSIYGKYGIKNGHFDGLALEYVHEACSELTSLGCDIILPGITELSLVTEQLHRRGIPHQEYGKSVKVGLLATSGTLQSRVYHYVLEDVGLTIVVPDDKHQEDVMESIYGKFGVKAGYTEGICIDHILTAANFLIDQKADVIILGCTELPLMFPSQSSIKRANLDIPLVDPTLVLALEIVGRAKASTTILPSVII